MEISENNVRGVSEDNGTSVLVIDASSSTADDHHWPNSELGEHSTPSEIHKSESWKEKIHFSASRFQDRASEFKASLLQKKKWKKFLEILSLSCTILVVWTVYTIPTIIFVLTSANKVCTMSKLGSSAVVHSKNECMVSVNL